MSEIKIMKKPDNISYEVIRSVIQEAHQQNIKKGLVTKTATMSAKELEDWIGKNGTCFVAMDGDKVVGTYSCKEGKAHGWFHNGKTCTPMLLGILPAYQGRGITPLLFDAVDEEARRRGLNTLFGDTQEENIIARKILLKNGWKFVGYYVAKKGHYSISMMKWLDDCPFSDRYCTFRYQLKRAYIRCRYRKSGTKRFGI